MSGTLNYVWHSTPHDPRQVESTSGFSFNNVRDVIFDASLNWYTLNASGQVLRNSVVDTTTSNATLLLYYNQVVYYQDASGQFRSWNGSAWINTTDPRVAESAQGATLNSATGSLFDASLGTWNLASSATQGFQVRHNGVIDTSTQFVILLLYYNHQVYQENSSFNWWFWNGLSWVAASDPRGTESADGVTLSSPTGTITDAALTPWTLQTVGAELKVAHNGIVDTNTSAVTLLLYFSHTVYYQNSSGQFWRWTGTAWAASTDPRVAESVQGTSLTSTTGIIRDANLDSWSLATAVAPQTGLGIAKNGVLDTITGEVVQLLYWTRRVYQRNSFGNWWYWDGAAWIASANPQPSITLNTIGSATVGQTFTVSGTITGYTTTAPSLQYRDNAGTWVGLPAGSTVSVSAFSFTHPAVGAATTSMTVSVRDAASVSVSGTSSAFAVQAAGSLTAPAIAQAVGYTTAALNSDFTSASELVDAGSAVAAPWYTGPANGGSWTSLSDSNISNSILTLTNSTVSFSGNVSSARGNGAAISTPGAIQQPNTQGRFFHYGVFEAKMRFNDNRGGGPGWPSFWGTSLDDGSPNAQGDHLEIDFMESQGALNSGGISAGFFGWFDGVNDPAGHGSALVANAGTAGYPNDWNAIVNSAGLDKSGGWNIFACRWTPTRLSFFWNSAARRDAGIADLMVADFPTRSDINNAFIFPGFAPVNWPLTQHEDNPFFYLILGGVNGANVQFDWVRVWQ